MSSHRLRWKGKVTGPHTIEEICALLAGGEVSRMHQVEQNGAWRPLDEFLRETEEAERVAAAARAESERQLREQEQADARMRSAALQQTQVPGYSDVTGVPERRISPLAVIAFVISFCSFIPFVNFVSWVPTVIMAHAALAEMDRNPHLRGGWLARAAIILSCALLVIGVLVVLAVATGFVKW